MEIDLIFDRIYPLPEDSKLRLKKFIKVVKYSSGHILLKANRIEKNIYFIKEGIVRAYTNASANEVTFWFGKEGDPIISMNSFVENKKGYEDIELLENCELYELKNKDLQYLFVNDIHIANWGRKFVEHELIKTEKRLISLQFQNASERYKDLLKDNPYLIQRVKLGHIASYLGITQVSLSRIRADIK